MARSNARLIRFGFLAALVILCVFIISKGTSTSYVVTQPSSSIVDSSSSNVEEPVSSEQEKTEDKPASPKLAKVSGNYGGNGGLGDGKAEVPKVYVEESDPSNEKDKVNAAFVTLARNGDLYELVESIREIEDRFNRKFHYDWVFLNDDVFDDNFKKVTSALVSGKTHYGKINKDQWGFPEWIDTDKAAKVRKEMHDKKIIYGDSISYRHMCRYESGFFFRHPLMMKYDYYWRVEPGIKIFCDINYDIFRYFHDNSLVYGFTISLPEYKETIPTLWDTTKNFMKENPQYVAENNLLDLISEDSGATYNGCHFWSNFEVGDLRFWRSEAYLKYFEYLDHAGGFFYERWGDAPVHSIAASLFLPREKVHFFNDVGYYHVPFFNCPIDENLRLTHHCSCNPDKDFTFRGYSCVNRYFSVKGLEKPKGWENYS